MWLDAEDDPAAERRLRMRRISVDIAIALSRKQAVLAGTRLAAVLNSILDKPAIK